MHGLPPSATMASVKSALEVYQKPIRDVRVPRDQSNGLSRGFGFVEYFSVADATAVLAACYTLPLILDGRMVSLSYADPARAPIGQNREVTALPETPVAQPVATGSMTTDGREWRLDPTSGWFVNG